MTQASRALANTFLRNLAEEARAAEVARNLARTAMKDAVYFGRPQSVIDDLARKAAALEEPKVQIEVPRATVDPVSEDYAVVGGPRSWAEERVLQAAGQSALDNAGFDSRSAMDAYRNNQLLASRVGRMSPEERARSLAAVAVQAMADRKAAAAIPPRSYGKEIAALAAGAGGLGMASMRPERGEPDIAAPGFSDAYELLDLQTQPPVIPPYDPADLIDVQAAMPDMLPLADDAGPDITFTPDSFDDSDLAAESRPGPADTIAGYEDVQPIPLNDTRVQQAVQEMVRSGVPVDRAMRIVGGQERLTADEIQNMFTGAR